MIVTNNNKFNDLMKGLRAFGWIRDMSNKDELAQKHSDIDPRFLFVNMGYNLRPTDIQGAFGIHQMSKLDSFIDVRRENGKYWDKRFEQHQDYLSLPVERPGTKHVYFAYPLLVKENAPFTRKEFINFLERKLIETRPIMAGNISEQPVLKMFDFKKQGELANASLIHRNGFFFGNHQDIGEAERGYIADCVDEFFVKHVK